MLKRIDIHSRFYGRGGAQAGGLGGEGLAESVLQTLTSHRFAGPSSPAESGRGNNDPALNVDAA